MSPLPARCVLLLVAVAFAPSAASAAAVALSYSAPESCPVQTQFVDAMGERGAALDSAGATARARAVDVTIRRVGSAYVGELTVHSLETDAATRALHDADCAEVVSGLALTAAIALGGGRAALAEPAAVSEPDAATSAATRTRTTRASTPPRAESLAVAEPVRRLRGNSFSLEDSVVVPAGTLQLEAARAYTLMAGATFGLIPDKIVPRYELNASVAGFLGLPGGESRLFGPLLQVHWAALGPVTTRHAGGVTLDSWGFEAGINSCSALTYDTAGWVALLCGEFGAGWLFAKGKFSGPSPREFEEEPGYGYAGLGLDVQYNFGSWAHLGLRAGGRLSTELSVDSPDGTRLFESSPWGGYATIGFGLHF